MADNITTKKLDGTGLSQVWSKIVELFATKESVTRLSEVLSTKADKATTLAGYGITDAYTKTEVDEIANGIKTDMGSVYRVKGSVAFASLPTEGNEAGHVYNITDAFEVTEAFVEFVEGAETQKSYPAGTNVVYTEEGKWDCLAGTYDFSNFATKDDIPVALTVDEINEICVLSTSEA